jgi:hypothetical protein
MVKTDHALEKATVGWRRHGEEGRRTAALGAVEMSVGGWRLDAVKNAKVERRSIVVALRWRAFLRGRGEKRFLDKGCTSGQEDTMLGH